MPAAPSAPAARRSARRHPLAVPVAALVAGAAAAAGAWWARPGPGDHGLAACVVPAARQIGRCGTVRVRENPDAPGGRVLALRVVVLPARGPGPASTPVAFLNGGPGLGAVDGVGFAVDALAPLRARHPLVFVDQRGTGRSAPLACPLADGSLQAAVDPSFPPAAARGCRDRLARRADLRQYTTARAADDLAAVFDTLSIRRAVLFGGSYGGRLALVTLGRHPARVAGVVALSAPPPEQAVPLAAGWAGARALAARAAECQADVRCRAAAPDPLGDVRRAAAALERRPARVARWNWRRLRRETVVVTPRAFAEASWAMLYSAGGARALFGLAHRAAMGDWTPWVDAAARRGRRRERGRRRGLTLAVLCTEDAGRVARALDAAPPGGPPAAPAPLGLPIARELVAACAGWPAGALAPGDTLPVRAPAPVLFLSGALDPVVPPEWADAAAAWLPNAVHLVDPAGGHAPGDGCAREAVARFVDGGPAAVRPLPCAAARLAPPPAARRVPPLEPARARP